MIEIIKEMILDFQQSEQPTGVPRHLEIRPVENKATILIGVRRSGKTTYLYQLIDKLVNRGVSGENIFYLNFFDDRLHELKNQGLAQVMEAYFSLYPEKKNKEKIYCFFDEIQVVPEWESFVDRVIRTEKCEVYITGSSSKMLSKEIATQMRGRAISWEVFPFSFLEFLDSQNISYKKTLTSRGRLTIQKALDHFWDVGGFPEVVHLDKQLRVKIHQEYFHAILFRDIIERHDVSHPRAIYDLAHWLINNAACLYSVNRLTGYLHSLGHKIPKTTVSEYLEWLEDSYFLFSLKIFDASISRVQRNPKKIFCIDHSLVKSISSGVLRNSGHLLENLVFSALRRNSPKISYYKTDTGREVDFVFQPEPGNRQLIQVCDLLVKPETKNREISALREAMTELKIKKAILVTRNESDEIEDESGIISVTPIWRFLLNKGE